MAKIVWDEDGTRLYETGTDRGVLYPKAGTEYPVGVPWNGLTGVTESPSGADETVLWADNIKYGSMRAAEEFGGTIEAYTYPDEWAECDGSAYVATGVIAGQQIRKSFGMTWRTLIGNDTDGTDYGYKIHLAYGATVSPSERAYATVNDSPEAITFSWEFTTIPVNVGDGFKPTSILTIDSTKADPEALAALENILYGSDSADAKLPLPSEVIELMGGSKTLSGITITTSPTKMSYTAGESFNRAGMVVTAAYSDSTTKAVTSYTVTPSGVLTTGTTSVTVSYTEGGVTKTATQNITVTAE